jgi:succinoglycan biosynthesis protein ExoO
MPLSSGKDPFFSVIIPVHNKAKTVGRAIRSVLAQGFDDCEVLVIDDASTDDSRAEMDAFLDDPRVRILYRDSPGPGGYAARNMGIREARGIWLAFLDADDEWYADHLKQLHILATRPGAGFVATGWIRIDRAGGAHGSRFALTHSSMETTDLDFIGYLEQALWKNAPAWTGVVGVRRSLMQQVRGFPESCRRGGDVVAWLRLVNRTGSLLCSPKTTAVYHTEDSTVTRTVTPEVSENCIYHACCELIRSRSVGAERLLLMQFSNLHISHALVHRVRSGTLRFSDCSFHYARANLRKHVIFRLFGLLPGPLQRRLWARFLRSRGASSGS